DIAYSSDGGRSWNYIATNVSGTSFNWTIPGNLNPGNHYRIRVSQASGTASDGSDVDFTITSTPIVVGQPGSASIVVGNPATFSVSAVPVTSYKWQVSTDSGATWKDIPGATGAILTVPTTTLAMTGTQYRVLLTNECGTTTSAGATLYVSPSGAGVGDLNA